MFPGPAAVPNLTSSSHRVPLRTPADQRNPAGVGGCHLSMRRPWGRTGPSPWVARWAMAKQGPPSSGSWGVWSHEGAVQAPTMGERPQGLSPASLGLHAHQRLAGDGSLDKAGPPWGRPSPGTHRAWPGHRQGVRFLLARPRSVCTPTHTHIGGLRNVLSVFVFNFDHVSHSDTFTRFLIKKVQKG